MISILTLCGLAIKEYYRRRLLIVLLVMAAVVAGTGLLSNPFTLGVQGRLMRDLALLFIQTFSILFALALSATSLPNEVERKLLYPFLARSITRGQYLWGKFLAISLATGLCDLVLGIELILVLYFSTSALHWMILAACLLIWMASMVTSAFAIWFSTFMTAPVAFATMVLLYVVGNFSHVYALTLTTGNAVMQWVLLRVKSLLPYFDYFSIRSAVTHDHPVSLAYIAATLVYGALYIVLAMLLAESAFSWRDL